MPTILCVDDNQDLQEGYRALFKSIKYRVLQAYDGKAGYDSAISHVPDIILTDYDMPIMNGFELSRALKNNPLTATIPIIGTGSFSIEQRKELSYFHEKGSRGLDTFVIQILSKNI